MTTHNELPKNLPAPTDDDAAKHLEGLALPPISLHVTGGKTINIGELHGLTVIYIYPMTGQPGVPLPDGWDQIPGARGCTPQSCSFRDHFLSLQALNTNVFGLSSQNTDYQYEVWHRLHLPFPLLSDPTLHLKKLLQLPTFEVKTAIFTAELYKRLTLIIKEGLIVKVFYPVFPPDQNAQQVIDWLTNNPQH
ncbi:MAG: peroxiredoxin [Methylotenera sp.]|nr:MAG: peroxiredoxin [Methylotenera sp.]